MSEVAGALGVCVQVALVAIVLAVAWANRRVLAAHRRAGLVFGGIGLLLSAPAGAEWLLGADLSRYAAGQDVGREALVAAVAVAGLLLLGVRAFYHGLAWGGAMVLWSAVRPEAVPVERPFGRGRAGQLSCAFLFGLAAAAASALIMAKLSVAPAKPAPVPSRAVGLEARSAAAPTVSAPAVAPEAVSPPRGGGRPSGRGALRVGWAFPAWASLAAFMLGLVGAALAEEIAFRGVLLGLALRAWGRTPWRVAMVQALVASLWAVQHLGVSTAPGVKFAQIFLLGLIFGEVARRGCLEAALAAHVGLNVGAPVMGMLLGAFR